MLKVDRRQKYKGLGYSINKSDKVIKMNFDLKALNLMCCYVLSENRNIRRSHLVNLRNLMEVLDMETYINDTEKFKRINFIKKGLEGKIDKGIREPYLVTKYIDGGLSDNDTLDDKDLCYILSNDELDWINDTVSSSLKYTFIHSNIDRMIDVCTRFKAADFRTKDQIVEEFEGLIDEFKSHFRKNRVESMSDVTFSLDSENFDNTVRDVHEDLINPSSRLYCGMEGLNELFGGGVENGRCYSFFGMSGSFKSGILLSLAYQLKKHNKDIKLKDPSKRPAIVLLTMENTVKESIERIFNMSTVAEDIRNFSADEVIDKLKEDGELYMNSDSPIDIIIKYQPNGSVDTGYLYTMVEELEDEGIETICVVQDYIRRIRSAYKQPDIRLEMGEVINEFKVFASIKDIPIITAAQLNRDASKTIETAAMANKGDLIRLLGRSNVGESMLIIDNIDWGSLIHIEYDAEGRKYIGFNVIKIRNNEIKRHVIYQPFAVGNNMKLVEDVHDDVPAFKETLRAQNGEMFNNGAKNTNPYTSNIRHIDDVLKDNKKYVDEPNLFASKNSSTRYVEPIANMFKTEDDPIRIPVKFG